MRTFGSGSGSGGGRNKRTITATTTKKIGGNVGGGKKRRNHYADANDRGKDENMLNYDEKKKLFTRLKFTLTVGGASIDGKENALKKLWANANIDNLVKRINIRATLYKNTNKKGGKIQHNWTTRPGLALTSGSAYISDGIHDEKWTKVDFSDFTYRKGEDSHKLKGEHQLAWYIKTNPKLMNPNLTDKEEQVIKECDLKYFPKIPLKESEYKEVDGRQLCRKVALTEDIELNHDNIFAKPNSGGTWSDLEYFLGAKTEVNWKRIRDECTSLACAWKKSGLTLYEKNKAGVWSVVAETVPAITKRLVKWVHENEEEKMVPRSD